MKRSWRALLAGLSVAAVVTTVPQASQAADVLVVGPGKIGQLRMGETTRQARSAGWIQRDQTCGSWTAGPKSYKRTNRGEIFKAYPEKIRGGRVLSMWATGEVVTAKGIRTRGLQSGRKGSSLATLRAAYPNVKRLGWWAPGADWGLNEVIYTAGSERAGWLDFYVDANTNRVSMMLTRADSVSWKAFKGADGC